MPTKNGRTFPSIVDGYWDAKTRMSRTRTVQKIGYLDEVQRVFVRIQSPSRAWSGVLACERLGAQATSESLHVGTCCKRLRATVNRHHSAQRIPRETEYVRVFKDPIAHFEAVANAMAEKAKETKEVVLAIRTDSHMEPGTDKTWNFVYAAISKVYHELKIDEFFSSRQRSFKGKYSLNAIMKMLVYSRILALASKRRTHKERGRYFDKMDFSLDDVYRSLSDISKYSEALKAWIHERISAGGSRDTSIVLYDVTNFYFEIDEQDEMRRKGVSKEHRPDPIVQMGLLMDNDGLPVAYQLFPVLGELRRLPDIGADHERGEAQVRTRQGFRYRGQGHEHAQECLLPR